MRKQIKKEIDAAKVAKATNKEEGETMTVEEKLGQIFENHSNCYADVDYPDGCTMAIDKEGFIEVVKELLTKINSWRPIDLNDIL